MNPKYESLLETNKKHQTIDKMFDIRRSLYDKSPFLLNNLALRYVQPSNIILTTENKVKPLTFQALNENIQKICADTSKIEASIKSEISKSFDNCNLNQKESENLFENHRLNVLDESCISNIHRNKTTSLNNFEVNFSPLDEKILQSPFQKIFYLDDFEYQDDTEYLN